MSDTVISVEHLSKRYRLGVINSGTFKDDLKIWFAQARGKPNPLSKVGEADHGNRDGDILWALKDINFTVQRGEALGIIGRNGAGKSTLLKILSRVTTPTEGHVHVKGRIASLLEVGTGFHPELTGRENIYLNGAIMGMDRKEVTRKFDEIVDFSGVEQFIDTPVKRYSSGMYVRLAFAVAAHLEPEILVVDEVLAVGDAEFQKKCLGKMSEVTGEGRTVLFVSHNMGAIRLLCQNSILIGKGEIKQLGPTQSVVSNYLMEDTKSPDPFANCGRKGNGQLRITSLHFEDTAGKQKKVFQSGEPIVFVLGYHNISCKPSDKISFSFSMHSSDQTGIFHLYSHFSNVYYSDLPEFGYVRCIIKEIPLSPNEYLIACRIVMNGDQYTGQELDWPQIHIPLKIIAGDFYKTGNLKLSNWGPVLVRGEWLKL